jgi:hypothetical protein
MTPQSGPPPSLMIKPMLKINNHVIIIIIIIIIVVVIVVIIITITIIILVTIITIITIITIVTIIIIILNDVLDGPCRLNAQSSELDEQLLLYNRAVCSTKMGLDHQHHHHYHQHQYHIMISIIIITIVTNIIMIILMACLMLGGACRLNAQSSELDEQLLLYNRAVCSTKMGLDHYALADMVKLMNRSGTCTSRLPPSRWVVAQSGSC